MCMSGGASLWHKTKAKWQDVPPVLGGERADENRKYGPKSGKKIKYQRQIQLPNVKKNVLVFLTKLAVFAIR